MTADESNRAESEIPDGLAGLVRPAPPSGPTQYGRIFPPRAEWLAKALPEEVIDPDIEIIDAHHHIWDLPGNRYMLEDFAADAASGHNVIGTVFEECVSMYRAAGPKHMAPVGEVEFAAGVGAMADARRYTNVRVAAGIVGFADLTHQLVGETLAAQVRAGGGRLKGVRNAANYDADPIIGTSHTISRSGLYREPEFRRGFETLSKLGLSFDAGVFFHQLGESIDLALTYPESRIVLCHTGTPLGYGRYAGTRDEVFSEWKRLMAELAKCPNVTVKLGGLMMRLAGFDYYQMDRPPTSSELSEHWQPYVLTAIELFGANRCMFESNFPVDKMGVGYKALWNAFKRMAAGASDTERDSLFSGVARDVYRL
jgi:L-fuconolactonase